MFRTENYVHLVVELSLLFRSHLLLFVNVFDPSMDLDHHGVRTSDSSSRDDTN